MNEELKKFLCNFVSILYAYWSFILILLQKLVFPRRVYTYIISLHTEHNDSCQQSLAHTPICVLQRHRKLFHCIEREPSSMKNRFSVLSFYHFSSCDFIFCFFPDLYSMSWYNKKDSLFMLFRLDTYMSETCACFLLVIYDLGLVSYIEGSNFFLPENCIFH